jgi:hypothetical protein
VKLRITTLVASGFLAFASSAMAGPLEDANAADERGRVYGAGLHMPASISACLRSFKLSFTPFSSA